MLSRFESSREARSCCSRREIGQGGLESVRPSGRRKTQDAHRSAGQFEQNLLGSGLRDGLRRQKLRSATGEEGDEVFVVPRVEQGSCRPVRRGSCERHRVERTHPHHRATQAEGDALRQGHSDT